MSIKRIDGFVTEAPTPASLLTRKMCLFLNIPILLSSIIKQNVSSAHIQQKIHITLSYLIKFTVSILNEGKKLQDLSSQSHFKIVRLL